MAKIVHRLTLDLRQLESGEVEIDIRSSAAKPSSPRNPLIELAARMIGGIRHPIFADPSIPSLGQIRLVARLPNGETIAQSLFNDQ